MSFYKWAGKLLQRKGKFAVAQSCCCEQWYCVLTAAGNYECRDKRPDPNENAQVLSEHASEKDCNNKCYERYYCIDENTDYRCVKEGDLPTNATIVSGPQRREECEAKCENCQPCGNEACEADANGDPSIIEDCCFNLADEEQWTFNGTDWELTQRCGNDDRTPCKGRPVAIFPQGLNAGDVFTLSCVPDGRAPEDNKDCEKCLFDCDKSTSTYRCVRAPDTGKYTEKECEKECAGLWYCVNQSKCEQQNPPRDPSKPGYETQSECLRYVRTDCCTADCLSGGTQCGSSGPSGIICKKADNVVTGEPSADFTDCLDTSALVQAIESQGWTVKRAEEKDCYSCGGEIAYRRIEACCNGYIDRDPASVLFVPRKADGDCAYCTGLNGEIEQYLLITPDGVDQINGDPYWQINRCRPIDDCVSVAGVPIPDAKPGWNYNPSLPCAPCFPDCVEKNGPVWQESESECNKYRKAVPCPPKWTCADAANGFTPSYGLYNKCVPCDVNPDGTPSCLGTSPVVYDTETACAERCGTLFSCGVPVPRTATVTLCGFIDRSFRPPCLGGQAGYSQPFNQTVQLTLQPFLPASGQIYWQGLLSLPDDYYPHVLRLYRGTGDVTGRECDWAQMTLDTPPTAPDDCASAFWVRNYNFGNIPLPPYSDGWTFGPSLAGVPTELRTQATFMRNIGTDNRSICRITFGDGAARLDNPLP